MKIIERRLTGKQSQEACEDGIVATNDFVAVIDGSTSKTPKRISEDMKNGRYAMLLIGKYIAQMPAQTSLTEFCTGITGTISDIYCSKGFDLQQLSRNPQERITASAVIYSKYYNEIWMVGDCLCMVDGKLYENSKPYEDILAERRATIIRESDNKEKFFIHDSARRYHTRYAACHARTEQDLRGYRRLPNTARQDKGCESQCGYPRGGVGIRRLSVFMSHSRRKRSAP